MTRRPRSLVLCLALTLALAAAPSSAATSTVVVANLPEVQEVRGTVSVQQPVVVEGRLESTRFVAFEDRLVAPMGGNPTPRDMVDLGLVDATGSASALASVAAWIPPGAAGMKEGGSFGLVLVPDVGVVRDAVERDRATPFGLRIDSPARPVEGRVATKSSDETPLAFPKWRAYLYNTSENALRVSAFVMLRD